MLKDWGSWDDDFRAMTRDMRTRLLALLGPGAEDFDCVPMQGSGSFCVEAMLGSLHPQERQGAGAGQRRLWAAFGQDDGISGPRFRAAGQGRLPAAAGRRGGASILAEDPAITHVVAIHCETSSGILNPVEEISEVTYAAGAGCWSIRCRPLARSLSKPGRCATRRW